MCVCVPVCWNTRLPERVHEVAKIDTGSFSCFLSTLRQGPPLYPELALERPWLYLPLVRILAAFSVRLAFTGFCGTPLQPLDIYLFTIY